MHIQRCINGDIHAKDQRMNSWNKVWFILIIDYHEATETEMCQCHDSTANEAYKSWNRMHCRNLFVKKKQARGRHIDDRW